MEVRSETGVMASREPFIINLQKAPVQAQPVASAAVPGMRLAYTSDGTAIYRPISSSSPSPHPSNQGSGGATGGGGGGAGVVGDGTGMSPPVPPHGLNINVSEPVKKKRGRPRKYGPDGTMNSAAAAVSPVSGGFSPSSLPSPTSADPLKKKMGRPPGSGKKQQLAALGSSGIGFTPHIITVKAGEDVSSKIMSFSQHGSRAVCILSAIGAVSNVTLRQAATSGGTVTYEGRFEILSLSGSFLLSESGGQRSRTGGLSVSLAGPDGRLFGGGVAGLLTAASPVQVVVGSFALDGKKEPKTNNPLDPLAASAKIVPRGTLNESSGGSGSPPKQSTGGMFYNNQQPLSTMSWN